MYVLIFLVTTICIIDKSKFESLFLQNSKMRGVELFQLNSQGHTLD